MNRVSRVVRAAVSCKAFACFAMALTLGTAQAELVKLEVRSSEVAFQGRQFGKVGAYELISAVAHFRIDPHLPVNAGLVNVHRAPRAQDGRVAFDTDVLILKPRDMQRGNARLVYEMVNRGRPLGLPLLNRVGPGSGQGPFAGAADGGDGFLLEAGFTYVISGWQAEYPLQDAPAMAVGLGSRLPRPIDSKVLSARLPIALERNGASVVATTREQFFDVGGAASFVGYLTYPAADSSKAAELTVRERDGDEPQLVPASNWRYLDAWRIEVTKPKGTSAGALFEFIYPGKDPVVYGLALASMRDLVSFLRYEQSSENPLQIAGKPGGIEHTIGFGASQTGRTLKELISEFNEDEAGRVVLDGAYVLISGAGRNSINSAFARPGLKDAQHTSWGLRGDEFPFSYPISYDALSRRSEGLLARCQATRTCPRIIHLDSENELWHGGTLTYVDTRGRDLPMPDTVRVFALAGTEHNAVPRAGQSPPFCAAPGPTSIEWATFARALFVALDRWVSHDEAPPASRYPSVAKGELVPRLEYAFPPVKEIKYGGAFSTKRFLDFSQQPPQVIAEYPSLVPQVDSDGHMMGGIRHPFVTEPLATNAGWNVRKPGFGEGDLCMGSGLSIPFAATRAERNAHQDPRPSIEERYSSEDAYVQAVTRAARRLAAERLLLPVDVEPLIQAARTRYRDAVDQRR